MRQLIAVQMEIPQIRALHQACIGSSLQTNTPHLLAFVLVLKSQIHEEN